MLVKLVEELLSSGAAAGGAAAGAVVGAGASVVAAGVSAAPQPDNSIVMVIIATIRAWKWLNLNIKFSSSYEKVVVFSVPLQGHMLCYSEYQKSKVYLLTILFAFATCLVVILLPFSFLLCFLVCYAFGAGRRTVIECARIPIVVVSATISASYCCHVTNSSSNNCNTIGYYITYVIVAYNNCSCQPIIMLKCEVGAMNNEPLKIKKRGEDGNRIISVRIREEILTELDKIAGESNYSRNELINLILDYGIKHIEIE